MNEEMTAKCLRQMEHIRGYLRHIYSIKVNQVMVSTVNFWSDDFNLTLLYNALIMHFVWEMWYKRVWTQNNIMELSMCKLIKFDVLSNEIPRNSNMQNKMGLWRNICRDFNSSWRFFVLLIIISCMYITHSTWRSTFLSNIPGGKWPISLLFSFL